MKASHTSFHKGFDREGDPHQFKQRLRPRVRAAQVLSI
jgi:hypothetical protein